MACIFSIGRLLRIIAVVLLLLVHYSGLSQEVTISAVLDTNRALIGDQLQLSIRVEKPAGVQVAFPQLKDTMGRKIEIVGDSYTDTAAVSADRVAYGRTLLITVFDTGFFEVPSLNFIASSGHYQDTLTTQPLSFMISSVPLDSALRDIKANFKAPLNLAEILYYAKENYPYGLLAVGAGLLTWFLIRYFRRKSGRKKDTGATLPAELPEVTALRELDRLIADKPWMHGRIKPYYVKLSEILRAYIEGRFHTTALEQTTEEILDSLKANTCTAADLNRLAGILRLADWVKFAKVIPDVQENARQVELAIEFVRGTAAQVTADPEAAEGEKDKVQPKISADV
jgi:hypothetical protein